MSRNGFVAAPVAQLRFNWLAVDTAPHDAYDRLRSLAGQAAALDDVAADSADGALAALTAATAAVPAPERGAVLRMRRDVFNGRAPRGDVPAAVAADPVVGRWVAARTARAALAAGLRSAYDDAAAADRESLRRACAHPAFLRALSLSTRGLLGDARRYPAGVRERSERALLRYADRARLRTSPFGWFTTTAHLSFGEGPALPVPPDGAEVAVDVDVAHTPLRRIADGVVAGEAARRSLRFVAAPVLRTTDEAVVVAVRRDGGHPRVYGNVDEQVSIRRTRAVDALLGWLAARAEPAPWCDLVGAVGSWGASITPEAAAAFVDGLVTAGLLRPWLPLPEQEEDLLGALRAFAASLPGETPTAVTAALDGVARACADLRAGASLDARAAALGAVDAGLREAAAATGTTLPEQSSSVYENTVVPGVLPAGADAWREVVADGASVATVLEAFDRSYLLRALVRDEFVARYGTGGRCDDMAALRDVVEVAIGRWGPAILGGYAGDPTLAAMEQVRAELVGDYLRLGREGRDELRLDPARVARVTEALAPLRRSWTSYSLFVQPEVDAAGRVSRVVLNHLYNGLGTFSTRYLRAAGEPLAEFARDRLRRVLPAGGVLAEIRPTCGFTANLHPLLADVDIDADGGVPGGWPLDRLTARHVAATGEVELADRATGRTVHVLYLGFLIPFLLPGAWASLYAPAARGPVLDPFGALAEAARSDAERAAVRAYPRVVLGRVVVERRRWHVPARVLAEVAGDGTGADAVVRLARWRDRHGVPDEVFVRHRPGTGRRGPLDGPPAPGEKPRYVHFLSPLRVRALAELVADGGELVVEEALPLPGDAPLTAGGQRVAEVVLELDRCADG